MLFHKKQFVSAACLAALRDGWGFGRKKCLALFSIFLLLSCLLVVGADMGPKDQLTVRLVNPPEEPYYLDLLWQPELSDGQQLYDNLSETEREELSVRCWTASLPKRGGLVARAERRHPAPRSGAIWRAVRTERTGACVQLCGPAAGLPPYPGDRERQNADLRAL